MISLPPAVIFDHCAAMTNMVIGLWLAAIAVTDARSQRIANAALLPGGVAVLASGSVYAPILLAAGVAALPYLLAFLLRQCGGGDVKLAAILGGLVGSIDGAVLVVVLASLLGLATHFLPMLVPWRSAGARGPPETPRAHAPALVGGALLVLGLTQ